MHLSLTMRFLIPADVGIQDSEVLVEGSALTERIE